MIKDVSTRPYQRMADRKLLKLYVASCIQAVEGDAPLGTDGFLQAQELTIRGYKVNDIADLQRRLEK